MTMRIDGQRQTTDTEAARRLEQTTTAERSANTDRTRRTSRSDRVEVSRDAQLVAAAIRAAEQSPAIRPDAVQRARQALADGKLGADAGRLADRIIDAWMGE